MALYRIPMIRSSGSTHLMEAWVCVCEHYGRIGRRRVWKTSLRSQRAPRFENVRISMGIGFWVPIAGERVSSLETTAGYWRMLGIKDREMTKH